MSNIGTKMLQAAAGAKPARKGSYIALGCNGRIQLLDHTIPGTLSLADSYSLDGDVHAKFSPDGKYIACSHVGTPYLTMLDHTTPGTLSFLDQRQAAPGHGVDWSPNGSFIVSAMDGGNDIEVLPVTNGTVNQPSTTYSSLPGNPPFIRGIAWSNSGNYIGVAYDTGFALLNISSGFLSFAASYTLAGGSSAVAFTPDDKYIAVGHGSAPHLTLLNHTTPGSVSFATSYSLGVSCVGLSFDETGSYLGAMRKSSSNTFTLLNHTTPGSLSFATSFNGPNDGADVAFSGDGEYVAIAYNNGFTTSQLTLFSRPNPNQISSVATYSGGSFSGTSVDFSPF